MMIIVSYVYLVRGVIVCRDDSPAVVLQDSCREVWRGQEQEPTVMKPDMRTCCLLLFFLLSKLRQITSQSFGRFSDQGRNQIVLEFGRHY